MTTNIRQLCEELESATRRRLLSINVDIRYIRKVKHDKAELIKLKKYRKETDQLLSGVRNIMKCAEIDREKYFLLRRKYLESTKS
jgi:hypothetical protein